jgi:putative copper resistance protein D
MISGLSAGDVLRAWSLEPSIVLPLAAAAGLYGIGVRRLTRRRVRWRTRRTVCFLAGIGVLYVALGSPIEAYSDWLLSVHMVQHLVLTLIAPPLLLLGRPITLAIAASPRVARPRIAALAHGRVAHGLGSPAIGFASLAIVLWVSHFSPLYEVALVNVAVHRAEHLAYVATALLFWWPIVARDPGAARLSHPTRMLYMFLAMPVMSLLGLAVSSAGHVLYAHYVTTSALLGTSALADQRLAGTIMWVSSMMVGVVALSAVLIDWMDWDEREAARADLRRDRARRQQGALGTADWGAE